MKKVVNPCIILITHPCTNFFLIGARRTLGGFQHEAKDRHDSFVSPVCRSAILRDARGGHFFLQFHFPCRHGAAHAGGAGGPRILLRRGRVSVPGPRSGQRFGPAVERVRVQGLEPPQHGGAVRHCRGHPLSGRSPGLQLSYAAAGHVRAGRFGRTVSALRHRGHHLPGAQGGLGARPWPCTNWLRISPSR